ERPSRLTGRGGVRRVAAEEVVGERPVGACANRRAGSFHQPDQEPDVVQAEQAEAEDLLDAYEVVKVGGRKRATAVAIARVVERGGLGAEAGVVDVATALRREEGAVSPQASWQDAVEHIGAEPDRGDQVLGRAEPHYVAGAVARQSPERGGEHREEHV